MNVSKLIELIPNVVEHDIVADVAFIGAELDSRNIVSGNLFFATLGEQVDGNKYAQTAIDNGAACVIVTDSDLYATLKGNKILVEDSLHALKVIGAERFKTCKAKKVAVTGSFGKTSMKEMLKLVLGESHNVYATSGNQNNELGLALTGAGIDDTADFIITELGSNAMGEIEALSHIVNPDIAIVVSIGSAHIGKFEGAENIATEKLSIAKGLKEDGALIIPNKFMDKVADIKQKVITFGRDKSSDNHIVTIINKDLSTVYTVNSFEQALYIMHPYRHVAENSLAVIAAAQILGISEHDISAGIAKYTPLEKHGNIVTMGDLTIINDTYNAGLESILTAIEALASVNHADKYAIIGEMLEISGYESELYSKIIELTDKHEDITFMLCGESYTKYKSSNNRQIYADKASCLEDVLAIKAGVMLVKAARAMKFEDFIAEIEKTHGAN